ncbi:MAG: fucose isomerase, partial [Pseudomonadota bacterium]
MATTEIASDQKHEQRVGLLALGRATFDVAFAEEKFAAILSALDAAPITLLGPRELLFDGNAASAAIEMLNAQTIDRLLIAQITFTDAAVTVEAAKALGVPVSIWAVPEPRSGGRLRLNAFCGLNLASHALGLNQTAFSWAYGDATDIDVMHLLSDQ